MLKSWKKYHSNNETMKYRLPLLFLLLFVGLHSVHSQNIQMNFEFLEGSNVNVQTMVLSNLEWVCINLSENQELAVEVTYFNLPDKQKPLPALYLNDGTSNISGAVPFPGSRAVFPVNRNGKLIRNMNGLPISIGVWIGLPPRQTRELTIEYN
jgi:hypothetical protein